jgi:hypothetical protein
MVSGNPIEIPRRWKLALHKTWTTPLILCSSDMPDYDDTGGSISNRLVIFRLPPSLQETPRIPEEQDLIYGCLKA